MACASFSVTGGVSASAETVSSERKLASATTGNLFLIIFFSLPRVIGRDRSSRRQIDLDQHMSARGQKLTTAAVPIMSAMGQDWTLPADWPFNDCPRR